MLNNGSRDNCWPIANAADKVNWLHTNTDQWTSQ